MPSYEVGPILFSVRRKCWRWW